MMITMLRISMMMLLISQKRMRKFILMKYGNFIHFLQIEAKARRHSFISDIDKVDEYNDFKEALMVLKNKDQKALQGVLGRLSGVKQEFLKQVLCSQRITVNDQNSKTAPKKIVNVKGKKKMSKRKLKIKLEKFYLLGKINIIFKI